MGHIVRRLLTLSSAAALLPASVAGAASPPTIYENTQAYPLGSRAAGMGGAYTALACDEAALHYNPASLACAKRSRVELAANAYMLEHFDAPGSLGPGQDITATSYHPLPSIAGFVRSISEGEAGTRAGALGFGFSVSVPRSIFLVVDPPDPSKKDFFSVSVRDDLLAADVGLGWQVSESFALGLSVGGAMRTLQTHSGILLVRSTPSPCAGGECFDFVPSESNAELVAIGARAKLGARWSPAGPLSFGLMIVSPALDLYGSAKISSSTTVGVGGADENGVPVANYAALPERMTGKSDLSLPGRVVFGAALALPQVLLSVDLSATLPRRVITARELEPIEIEGVTTSADPIPDEAIELELRPNVNAGAEIPIADWLVVDLGFFTDLSTTSDADLAADNADRIDMFGFTAAVGLLGKQARSWFGLSFQTGSGTTRVRARELTFEQLLQGSEETMQSTYSRWSLVGIIGSSYSFVDDAELPAQ